MSKQIGYIYGLIKSNRTSTKALETQYSTCSKYADAHEIEVKNVYFDNLSDGSGVRADMARMLENALKDRVAVILVSDLSCIDPDIQQAGKYLEKMRQLGLQVISIKGIGGNIFDTANNMLPESIFNYLKFCAKSVANSVAPRRGRRVLSGKA